MTQFTKCLWWCASAGESVPAELRSRILPRQAGGHVQALSQGLRYLCRRLLDGGVEVCVLLRPGFYATQPNPEIADGHRICRRCDASCLTCVGPSRGNCSSCSSGHSLQEGVCVVSTGCTDGQYQDSSGKCHACDATCLKCTGPQSEDCISCVSSRALDEGRCVLECAKGKYQSGGRCHLCDHTCATCVDAGPANCNSCDTDKFGVERYLYKGQCLDACPEAFYHTKEMSCEPCSDHCWLCTSSAYCLKCNSSYYVSDGACMKLECGEGEVEDPDYDDCMACEEGCSKCVLYNPRHCLSCTEGFYKNCPAKTYSVDEEMTCVPCDDNCVSCDEHECYWCETDLFLSEGRCVSVCPIGFYGDEDTNDCEECHSDCVTCSGPEDNDCLSCEEGTMLENGECVSDQEVCPIKTFRTDDDECEDCHPSCESCYGEERNQCTKCTKGLGYPAGQVCRSCAAGCESCGRNATHCLNCEEPLVLHKHQCVEECPPAHMLRDGECQRCPSACQECSPLGQCTALKAVLCAGCEEYHFLHEGLCVLDCPERFFEDKDRGECLRCHPDCVLCDGPNDNDCDTCADPEAILHNGACLVACSTHTYRDTMTGDCEDCDASCLTCSGPHASSCTSCREGLSLEGHGHCVPSPSNCLPHQYANQDGECHPCHKYCRRCSGPRKTECLSCNQRHLLLNGTCADECPSGYYEDESGQKCEPCHPSCDTCVGRHSQECLTCKAHLFREGKECVETCQHGHYGNTGSRMCERCDPSCGECMGAREDSCLSCAPGLIYMRREGRCLPSCPLGYHHDSMHRTCEPCHATCRTCSEGMCESMCDISQYPVMKGSGHACEDCDTSCLECRGPGPANCTMCPAQAILEAGGRCLLCCRQGEDATTQQQDCCNCTETRGECVLSTNLAFTNDEEEEARGNLTVFIIACVLLVLGLVALVFLIRHSRSKSAPPDIPPRGYEKLGSGGGYGGGSRHGGYSSSASYSGHAGSSGGRFQEAQLVDIGERRSGSKDDDDDDDEDEDIVYMGQDGTVYRKFRYGQLGEDNDDELEYDDESYTFR
ncbi:hypothetical protein INR49_025913 [Caranx melampygus]|nr:hypothetical protein INR49_025913 [Caranx melampygus]